MYNDSQTSTHRVPTLVQYCQRVASAHVDSISSLGDGLRFELLKPIIEGCSVDTLLRLEKASPYIENDTTAIWKGACFKAYPLAVDRYRSGELEEPESWRDEYFVLREAEAKRFEELGSRLRVQRLEAEERKKEKEIKLTDKVPLPKRARTGWSTTTQPKSLIQKARSEAHKIQKNIYTARIVPPMPVTKSYAARPCGPSSKLLPSPPSSAGSFATAKDVPARRSTSTSSSSSLPSRSPVASRPIAIKNHTRALPQSSPAHIEPRSNESPVKKDSMSSIFMPKHRAHSQRPIQPQSISSK